MFKKLGCLLPVLAVLLFLTYISIKQGYNTIFHEDWSENFSDQKVVVVDIAIDSSYTSATDTHMGSYHYTFNPIVKYEVKGKTVVDTIVFMTSYEEPEWYPGDSVTININKFDGNLSKDIDTDRNFTGIINIIMGLVFLFISYLIIRSIIRKRVAQKEEIQR